MSFASTIRRTLAIAIAFVATTAAAQTAGRVLVAAGEVFVTRAGQDLLLATGAELQPGDVVHTGPASSAQLGFTDGAVVSLRARSRFEIANYRFTGQDDGFSEAVFRLVRGGLRTLTGLIGSSRRDSYRMHTPLATLGIRGTTYALVHCEEDEDCLDDDGSPAPDGTYGIVFEGRVAVGNAGGEVEFGAEEAFHVPDARTPPQLLAVRPRFVRDRLEARTRREARREAMQARAQAMAEMRSRAAAIDPRAAAVVGTPLSPIIVADLRDESGNVALLGPGLGVAVAFGTTAMPVAAADGGRGTVVALDGDRGFLDRFILDGGTLAGDRGDAAVLDRGSLPGDGGAVWGRWAPGATVQGGGLAGAPSTGVHFLFGNLTPEALFSVAPAAATAVHYDYAGGPSPTDGQGHTGEFLRGGFIVDFVNRSIGGVISYRVGDITYALPVPTGTALSGGRGFVGFRVDRQGAGEWTCASCNGASGVLDRYAVTGVFLGSRAQGLGVTFGTQDVIAGRSAGAAIFRCVAAACR